MFVGQGVKSAENPVGVKCRRRGACGQGRQEPWSNLLNSSVDRGKLHKKSSGRKLLRLTVTRTDGSPHGGRRRQQYHQKPILDSWRGSMEAFGTISST